MNWRDFEYSSADSIFVLINKNGPRKHLKLLSVILIHPDINPINNESITTIDAIIVISECGYLVAKIVASFTVGLMFLGRA